MKKLCLIVAILCLVTLAKAQSIINFSWNMTGTTFSNANNFIILYGTNTGQYFGSTNCGSLTNITITNFPHGITWYFTMQCSFIDTNSNTNILGYTPECTYGYLVPTPAPVPVIVPTVIQP